MWTRQGWLWINYKLNKSEYFSSNLFSNSNLFQVKLHSFDNMPLDCFHDLNEVFLLLLFTQNHDIFNVWLEDLLYLPFWGPQVVFDKLFVLLKLWLLFLLELQLFLQLTQILLIFFLLWFQAFIFLSWFLLNSTEVILFNVLLVPNLPDPVFLIINLSSKFLYLFVLVHQQT